MLIGCNECDCWCWFIGLHAENLPRSITARTECRYMLRRWRSVRLPNWWWRLVLICHWSLGGGVLEFHGWRDIRDIRVTEFLGIKYLQDREWTSGGSGVAEAAEWIEWCGGLEGGAWLLGHASPSWWGSIFDHYKNKEGGGINCACA